MDYTEVIINTRHENIDPDILVLESLGAEGFVIEDESDFKEFLEANTQYWDYVDKELEDRFKGLSRIKFYLNNDPAGKEILANVLSRFPEAETSTVKDSDWENNWRKYYKPIEIGKRLAVVPQWESESYEGSDRTLLKLDPGLIFGTGSHATTKMCLESLEAMEKLPETVLDLGCGSGILGIGALLLGSLECVGCDIDPKAPDVAYMNACLNGIGKDRYTVYAGDIISDMSLRKECGSGYGLVIANIVADVIIPLSSFVKDFMSEDALFICSGIIDNRRDEVEAALNKNGFEILEHKHLEEWNCYITKSKRL